MKAKTEPALCQMPQPLADLTAREAAQLLDGYQSARADLPLDKSQDGLWQEGWHRFHNWKPSPRSHARH